MGVPILSGMHIICDMLFCWKVNPCCLSSQIISCVRFFPGVRKGDSMLSSIQVGLQNWFCNVCNLCLAIEPVMLLVLIRVVQLVACNCNCLSQMWKMPYSYLLNRIELGVVLANPNLCLKVVASLLMRKLQVFSGRIISFRRYSRLGVST